MKIAVATDNGNVSAHFGHCTGFTIFDIENAAAASKNFIPNPGHEPGFLPVFLKDLDVEIIIAGGMGNRAQTLFNEKDINVIVGASGSVEEAVSAYLSGSLESTGSFCDH